MQLANFIRDVPNFPKPGIVFKDITPLLKNPQALHYTYKSIANHFSQHNIDLLVGAESRGFLFGVGVACVMNKGFVPIRKPGKLPAAAYQQSYDLEYGADSLEIHRDGILPGQRVLIIDDLLATGGTAGAAIELVKKCGGIVVGCAFVIELSFLKGRDKLAPNLIFSLINYD